MQSAEGENAADQTSRRRKRQRDNSSQKKVSREENLRARNLKILKEKPDVEKCLEDLVFGGEDEFVERLMGNAKTRLDVSADLLESDSDDEHPKKTVTAKKAAWVDEDDDLDERLWVKVRFNASWFLQVDAHPKYLGGFMYTLWSKVCGNLTSTPLYEFVGNCSCPCVEMTHRYRKDIMKSTMEKTLSKNKLHTRLQAEFQKAMGGVPSWASTDSKKRVSKEDDDDSEDDDEDNLLRKTGNLLAKSTSLLKGFLQMKPCLNANHERPGTGPLTTVQFHPSAQVVMTAGLDRSVSLFQVDGKLNPKIQSIHLEKFPVFKARFSTDGEQVIATGLRQKMFYVYDMIGGSIIPMPRIRGLEEKCVQEFEVSPNGAYLLLNGSSGFVHLLSMKTKELIGSMKMNAAAIKASFTADSSKIFSSSSDGDVYVWDVKSRRCLNRFQDDGSLCETSLALSKDGRFVSCGSSSGVVNIYNFDDCLQATNPKPLKSIMNLVTTASSQVFSPQNEILAVASHTMDDAVKLVHIPSFTVFSNFPVQGKRRRIHLARSMDFSPHSGYFSIANNKGDALLYRLKHYSDF